MLNKLNYKLDPIFYLSVKATMQNTYKGVRRKTRLSLIFGIIQNSFFYKIFGKIHAFKAKTNDFLIFMSMYLKKRTS